MDFHLDHHGSVSKMLIDLICNQLTMLCRIKIKQCRIILDVSKPDGRILKLEDLIFTLEIGIVIRRERSGRLFIMNIRGKISRIMNIRKIHFLP